MKRFIIPAVVLASLLSTPTHAKAGPIRLLNLNNQAVDPFDPGPGGKAVVAIFTATDCPISNRYAPEVRRIYETFAPQGVRFWLVYPNPAESTQSIREHAASFGYPADALRDPDHALVKFAKATVTPEVAVFAGGRLVYRGRIDDRFVDLGRERPAPTRHDLSEALSAVLAGKEVAEPTTQAVGCFLADFVR